MNKNESAIVVGLAVIVWAILCPKQAVELAKTITGN